MILVSLFKNNTARFDSGLYTHYHYSSKITTTALSVYILNGVIITLNKKKGGEKMTKNCYYCSNRRCVSVMDHDYSYIVTCAVRDDVNMKNVDAADMADLAGQCANFVDIIHKFANKSKSVVAA